MPDLGIVDKMAIESAGRSARDILGQPRRGTPSSDRRIDRVRRKMCVRGVID